MKRKLRLVALLSIPLLACLSSLPLTRARADRQGHSVPRAGRSTLPSQDSPAILTQQVKPYRRDVDKILERYDSLELDPERVAQDVRSTGRLLLPTAEGVFDLKLTLHDMRSPRYRAEVMLDGGRVELIEPQPVNTYKGTIAGVDQGQARITIDENTVEGLIITPSHLYFVEPARRYSTSAGRNDFVIYKDSDVIQTTLGECGVTLAERVGTGSARVKTQVPASFLNQGIVIEELFSPPRVVDLATEADFEYFQAFGSAVAANNEIITIMNQVEGIFEAQIGLQFSLVFQSVWATANDPYTATEAGDAIDEFRDFWLASRESVSRDLAHMWTGKNFDGGTIGIASRPGFECPFGSNAFGMTQNLPTSTNEFLVTAHEIGHGFNASHTDDPTPQPGCANTIMGSTLGGTTSATFCPFSVNQIETHSAANANCLAQGATPGCTYSLSPSSQSIVVGGGPGSVNVTTVGTNCTWGTTSTVSWIFVSSGTVGTNSGHVNFTVSTNQTGYARSGVLRIAEQTATVNQPGGPGCAITPITTGQTINANLSNSDCTSSQRPSSFADQYSFSGVAGQEIRIEMNATTPPQQGGLDTYLYLLGPNGNVVEENDDTVLVSQTNSRIPQQGGAFTLPQTGTYIIESTSFDDNATGGYTLTLLGFVSPNNVAFDREVTFVAEGVDANGIGFEGIGFRTITVLRTGSVSSEASVDYSTTNASLNSADSRKDYAQARGTLRFAAGETSKSFVVFITDDVFQEDNELIILTLSNPVGTTLAFPSTSSATISSNDPTTGPNPVDPGSFNTGFFVRQHYLDFFTREPDLAGLNFWKNQIDECTTDACREVRRINVSGAFFLSIEFQQTGYLVYRTFATAFGPTRIGNTVPLTLEEFVPDVQRIGRGVIIGTPGDTALLEANKEAFFNEFVARPQFIAQYPVTQTPAQFVDALNANALALSQAERDALVADLTNATKTRAQVLRAVAEDSDLINAHRNKAFVLMQYFGYLRRNPNDAPEVGLNFDGYNFWLTKLNDFNGNFVNAEMVKAFIISGEYKQRFGP